MIVRQFISWVRTASAGERAEATRSLARAWLVSDLNPDDRAAAEGALLMLLDDASPLVRQAMAEVFARSAEKGGEECPAPPPHRLAGFGLRRHCRGRLRGRRAGADRESLCRAGAV